MSVSPSIKRKRRKKTNIRTIFIWSISLLTVFFCYLVIDYFCLDPLRQSGKPVYGERLTHLTPLDPKLLQSFETSNSTNEAFSNISISVRGPIIYLNVTVSNETTLDQAKKEAQQLSDQLMEQLGSALEGYTLQLVLSTDEYESMLETNREKELAHIKEHDLSVVEKVVAYTEKYPTQTNVDRSQANIDLLAKTYPVEAQQFQERLDQLTPYTEEEEAALSVIPNLVVDQTIPTSQLTDYPLWGIGTPESPKIKWH